jgi:hypothetical protein
MGAVQQPVPFCSSCYGQDISQYRRQTRREIYL